MKRYFLTGVLFILLGGLSAAEGGKVYTEQDLQKYMDRDGRITEAPPAETSGQHGSSTGVTKHDDRQAWCERGRAAEDRLLRAKAAYDSVLNAPENTAARNVYGNPNPYQIYGTPYSRPKTEEESKAEAAVTAAEKELKEAEADKKKLEDEAFSHGVPDGWLRCQFE